MRTIYESLSIINQLLTNSNITPLTPKDIVDWELTGNETFEQLQDYTRDYISECHTERCAERDSWRYEL